MIGVGRVFALAGGSCAILCRPVVAGVYGAVVALLMVGSAPRE
jgi:hypothetical protein